MSENLKVNSKTSILEFKRKHNKLVDEVPSDSKIEQISEYVLNKRTKPYFYVYKGSGDSYINVQIYIPDLVSLSVLKGAYFSINDYDFSFDLGRNSYNILSTDSYDITMFDGINLLEEEIIDDVEYDSDNKEICITLVFNVKATETELLEMEIDEECHSFELFFGDILAMGE